MIRDFSLKITQNTELFSLLIIILFFSFVTYFIFSRMKEKEKKEDKDFLKDSLLPSSKKTMYSKKDYYYIVLLTGIYAIVSGWMLGNPTFPNTTWQPSTTPQTIILELPEQTAFDTIYLVYGEGDNNHATDYQIGFHNLKLEGSQTLHSWEEISTLDDGSIYQYTMIDGVYNYKYIRITSTNLLDTISEIGFVSNERFLPIQVYEDDYKDSIYPATLLIDEQAKLVYQPTYYDQGFFDEIYHPRNAWEIYNQQYMYAHVHPLFGTSIMAFFMMIFGCTPFGWRFGGWLFGVFLVPLFYCLIKLLFKKTKFAFLGTLYLCIEFMHLTTSRIGTLEPYSVFFILLMYFFMLKYDQTNIYDTPLKKRILYLFLCGLTMALGFATKWTACYSAIGLAIIFFVHLYRQYKVTKNLQTYINDHPELDEEKVIKYKKIYHQFYNELPNLFLLCVLFFILIPVIVYFLAYTITPVWREGYSIQNVINQTIGIYDYHAHLEATHPYQSTWYQWLLDLRPTWYYIGNDQYAHTIACFTHPLLTWLGLITIIYTCIDFIAERNHQAFIILVGYLTALLPWVFLVSRCVFSYHFYPTSFFMILSIVYFFNKFQKRFPTFITFIKLFTMVSIIVFILYLPVLTGWGTTWDYVHALEFFSSWYFG